MTDSDRCQIPCGAGSVPRACAPFSPPPPTSSVPVVAPPVLVPVTPVMPVMSVSGEVPDRFGNVDIGPYVRTVLGQALFDPDLFTPFLTQIAESGTFAPASHVSDSSVHHTAAEIGQIAAGRVAEVVAGAPAALDTLKEIADVIGTETGQAAGGILKRVADLEDGKADKSEMLVTPGTGADADKTTIRLKSGTSATVLTAHQDVSGKADASDVNAALARKLDVSSVFPEWLASPLDPYQGGAIVSHAGRIWRLGDDYAGTDSEPGVTEEWGDVLLAFFLDEKANTADVNAALAQKQGKLSDDQIGVLDREVVDLHTYIQTSGGDENYFIRSSSTFGKSLLIEQGILSSDGTTWIHQPIRVVMGSNVNFIEVDTFRNATNLLSFVGENVQVIQSNVFSGCTALTSVSIPSVGHLGSYTFQNCTSLKNLTLPQSLLSVSRQGFYGSSFDTVIFEGKTLAQVKAMASYSKWGLAEDKIYVNAFENQIGDATITLTQGGVTKGTFKTNQGADATIDLDAGGGGGSGHTVTVISHVADGTGGSGRVTVGGFSVKADPSYILNANGHACPSPLVLRGIEYLDVPAQDMSESGLVYLNGTMKEDQFVQLTGDTTIDLYYFQCVAGGTLIPLADGTSKPIEEITYDDELLVWDFDEGKISAAKPAWIKRADYVFYSWETKLASGKSIKTCGQHGHRFFDSGTNTWVYADQISGRTVYTLDGDDEVISSERIDGKVNFYNIITKGHINHFGNGILLGCSLENFLYPVVDMKFVKDSRALRPYEEFAGDVPEWWYTDCRYAESTAGREYLVKYFKDRVAIMKPGRQVG